MAKISTHGGRSLPQLLDSFGGKLTSIQQPSDLITLMTYSISLLPAIRLSIEAGIFRRLAKSSSPLSLSELAQDLPYSDNTEDVPEREEFVSRLLRAICGLELVDQVGRFSYQANDLTVAMTDDGYEAGWMEMYDNTTGPNSTYYQQLQWVKDHGFRAPADATDGAYQRARGIVGTPTFQHWAKDDPKSLQQLSVWMSSQQKDRVNWDTWFPVDELFSGSPGEDTVFMVDVGGGLGHDLSAFAARNPERNIRLVNEDLPEVIQQAREQTIDRRIQLVEQDFLQEQSVKGAQIYYLHKILHDWPDKDCITILGHLRDAMSSGSRILINDAVLPDQDCPLLLTAWDWTMLVQLSGKERSESMWKRLVSEVGGLTVKKFWTAPQVKGSFGEDIIEVVKTAKS